MSGKISEIETSFRLQIGTSLMRVITNYLHMKLSTYFLSQIANYEILQVRISDFIRCINNENIFLGSGLHSLQKLISSLLL